MIKVSIITAEMRGINGANRVTEKLIFGQSFFNKHNIVLNYLYTDVSTIKCCDYSSSLGDYSANYLKKRTIIEKLKKLPIYRTKLVQSHLQKKVIKFSKKATNRYLFSNDDSDVIIFQDVFCAYHFLKEILKLKEELYQIISDKSGKSIEQIRQDADRDHWMTAQEALEYGMIDRVFTRKE